VFVIDLSLSQVKRCYQFWRFRRVDGGQRDEIAVISVTTFRLMKSFVFGRKVRSALSLGARLPQRFSLFD